MTKLEYEPAGFAPAESARAFIARYAGHCHGCGDPFAAGDRVRYDGGHVVGATCCTGVDDRDDDRAQTRVTLNQVMPHGRKVYDRCAVCFIIPANNGVCNCD